MTMRDLICKIGRLNTVIINTIISTLLSVLITLGFFRLFSIHSGDFFNQGLIIATIAPLIISPPTAWMLIGLILEIDALEKKMRELAMFDGLTGLLSRSAFFYDAATLIDLSYRTHPSFSLLLIDLDNFKRINDQYGHPAGDAVLKNFSKTIKPILRSSDIAGRIGGEEFTIMLPNTHEEKAFEISERLHSAIRESVITYDNLSIKYSVSIGLVSATSDKVNNIDSLLKQADIALYHAKDAGKNGTIIFKHGLK